MGQVPGPEIFRLDGFWDRPNRPKLSPMKSLILHLVCFLKCAQLD